VAGKQKYEGLVDSKWYDVCPKFYIHLWIC